jgi:hypothetical protein
VKGVVREIKRLEGSQEADRLEGRRKKEKARHNKQLLAYKKRQLYARFSCTWGKGPLTLF